MGYIPRQFAQWFGEALDRKEWWAILVVIFAYLFILIILLAIGAMVIFAKH